MPRLQFSLRAVLALTALSSLLLSWLVTPLIEFHRQRQIAEDLERRGIRIGRENYQQDNQAAYFANLRAGQPPAPPPGPAWARWLYGDDFFVNVTSVTWRGEPPRAADFRLLAKLRHLHRLYLADLAIDDEDVRHLPDQVRELDLRGTAITDAGLEHFAFLPHAERIFLARTQVTDRGIAKLRRRVNPVASISW
jgi:hypothetical protein